jgi:hypothetical protein
MKIHLSKLDAAKRQLETAIQLVFTNGDPVSIHALTCASYEILEAICKKQNLNSVLDEGIENFVRADKKKGVRDKIHQPKNFIKHADRDPEGIQEFNPDLSLIFIWDACRLYRCLTSEFTKDMFIFTAWYTFRNPDTFNSPEYALMFASAGDFDLSSASRFYHEVSPLYDSLKLNAKIESGT